MSPQALSNFHKSNSSNHTAVGENRAQEGDALEDGQEVKSKSNAPSHEVHEESWKPRAGRVPVLPTKTEIDERFPLRLKYRSLCEHCVAGKAKIAQHNPA